MPNLELNLAAIEKEYTARKAELHSGLVEKVRIAFEENIGEELDPRVEEVLRAVPRHRFLRLEGNIPWILEEAYDNEVVVLDPFETRDEAIEILKRDYGIDWNEVVEDEDVSILLDLFYKPNLSTASQPSIVAQMTQLVLPGDFSLKDNWKALEVGSGGGYQAAMLSAVGFSQVYGVEIKDYLVEHAKLALRDYQGIEVIRGDGSKGLPDQAPFDAIVVTAGVERDGVVPTLLSQLNQGGVLVVPEKMPDQLLSRLNLEKQEREIGGHKFTYVDEPLVLTKYKLTMSDNGEPRIEGGFQSAVSFVRLRSSV